MGPLMEKLNALPHPSFLLRNPQSFLSTFLHSCPSNKMSASVPVENSFEAIAKRCIKAHRVFFWCANYIDTKENVVAALKKHYADVCSGGDLCMQSLLAFLEAQPSDNVPTRDAIKALYDSEEVVRHYWDSCWSRLRETLCDWLDEGALCPDPLWAD